ncbi:MAG: hypothetical protein KJN90_06125 [Gammaproteobacteria bacterium]|nr:hypothetical protein [Gammaproteobacteria bacterium]
MNCILSKTIFLAVVLSSTVAAWAQVPDAVISGPIEATAAGDTSRNFIYNASAIELAANGYIEEEYFIEGTANRYSTPALATGEIEDSGHPYKTRFFVRRPASASDFNGTVIIEWLNVTGGTDKDIDWWQSGHHLVANGYAFIGVSAQAVGIASLREWSPGRYGTLDVTHDGMVENDALSYDIFSAVAKGVGRVGEPVPAGEVDILDGLRAERLIATGHSQSASRLTAYLNHAHPRDPVFDGVMIHGGGGRVRDDQDVRIFKIMAETDMPRRSADRQPDTDYFRQWEVAGSSHVDIIFELEFARMLALSEGQSIESAAPREQACQLPPYSRVPFRDVMNAAFEHLVNWIDHGTAPPTAPSLQVARWLPELEFARDEYGNILGGIRLAEHAVPTARNTGLNSAAAGGSRFCFLYGSHEPFDAQTLQRLYPSHDAYVQAVREVAEQNMADGYILPEAAQRTIQEAEDSSVGR